MLLQNKRLLYQTPGFLEGGALYVTYNSFKKNYRSVYYGETYNKMSGLPLGTEGSYSYVMPQKAGFIVSRTGLGSGNASGNILKGLNLEGQLSGDGDSFGVVVSIISLSGQIDGLGITQGSLTGSFNISGIAEGNGFGEGLISALISLDGVCVGISDGIGNLKGDGFLEGHITPFTELSPEGLASALWNSLSSQYNIDGTMGAKLNAAGSGGVDLNALAQAVWEYATRNLTESDGLTLEEFIALK